MRAPSTSPRRPPPPQPPTPTVSLQVYRELARRAAAGLPAPTHEDLNTWCVKRLRAVTEAGRMVLPQCACAGYRGEPDAGKGACTRLALRLTLPCPRFPPPHPACSLSHRSIVSLRSCCTHSRTRARWASLQSRLPSVPWAVASERGEGGGGAVVVEGRWLWRQRGWLWRGGRDWVCGFVHVGGGVRGAGCGDSVR